MVMGVDSIHPDILGGVDGVSFSLFLPIAGPPPRTTEPAGVPIEYPSYTGWDEGWKLALILS